MTCSCIVIRKKKRKTLKKANGQQIKWNGFLEPIWESSKVSPFIQESKEGEIEVDVCNIGAHVIIIHKERSFRF